MKIAIDISQIAYPGTGVANYTRDLVANLLLNDKKNNYILFAYSLRRLSIIADFAGTLSSINSNFSFKSFRLPQSLADFIWNGLHILTLEKLIGKVDIYHSSDWIQIPSSARKITTVHDLIVYRLPQTSHSSIIKTQKKRLVHVRNECDHILADSYSTKDDLTEILSISSQKISVVYPGISGEFKKAYPSSVASILKKFQIKKPYILAVGKNDPRKNLTRVVSAFKKSNLQCSLVIISTPGWAQNLKQENNIRILEDIKSSDLPSLYSGAEMLVFPSLYEGFGLPIVEAFACGCPVITSRSGSLKEVAKDAALFVNPYSISDISVKMVNLFNDKNLSKKLISRGLVNSERFSWEISVKKIIDIYNRL